MISKPFLIACLLFGFSFVFDKIAVFCYNRSIEKISISLILSLALLGQNLSK
nr:MAG TPA: hypothetical protein [Caudoviricetes sp.]